MDGTSFFADAALVYTYTHVLDARLLVFSCASRLLIGVYIYLLLSIVFVHLLLTVLRPMEGTNAVAPAEEGRGREGGSAPSAHAELALELKRQREKIAQQESLLEVVRFEKETLQREIALHTKRICQLEQQLDHAHGTVEELSQSVRDMRALLNAYSVVQHFVSGHAAAVIPDSCASPYLRTMS